MPSSHRRKNARRIKKTLHETFKSKLLADQKSLNRAYGENIAVIAKSLVSQRFNPHYNSRNSFDRSWDNVRAPEPATTKIAKLWRRQYLANINKYPTRNNPAASYPGLL